MFLQLLVGGIVVGCIYALIGLGYSLIYSASGLMSFVQGEIFMLGAYVAFTMYVGFKIPFLLAVLVAIAIMFVFGMFMERSMISPLLRRGAEQIHIVLATIGLSIFLKNFAMIIWGIQCKEFSLGFWREPLSDWFNLGFAAASDHHFCDARVHDAPHLFMNKTRMGTSLRAAAQDSMAAGVAGINVPADGGHGMGAGGSAQRGRGDHAGADLRCISQNGRDPFHEGLRSRGAWRLRQYVRRDHRRPDCRYR